MHTVLLLAAGLLMLLLFMLFGWLWGASTGAMVLAAKWFVPAWLVMALVTMAVGVVHAGYSVREELPVLVLAFAAPAALAAVAIWLLARA